MNKYSILDLLFIVFTSIIIVFYFFSLSENPYILQAGISLAAILFFVFAIIKIRKKKPKGFLKGLLVAYPVVFLLAIFETFFMILPFFNEKRYDEALSQLDFMIFGVNPTVWVEQFIHPWLTELLYVLYFFYYPLPVFILIWLYRKKLFVRFEKAFFILLVINFGAYIIYFFVPAVGPRFYLADLHSIELTGLFFSKPINDIIGFMEPNKYDAFPSLHTATLMTTMWLMWKNYKKMFWVFVPIAMAIIFSLVYCRYHYVVDIIMGIIWTVTGIFIANFIYDKFHSKFINAFDYQDIA